MSIDFDSYFCQWLLPIETKLISATFRIIHVTIDHPTTTPLLFVRNNVGEFIKIT